MQVEMRWWWLIGVVSGCFDPKSPLPVEPTPVRVCDDVPPLTEQAPTWTGPQVMAATSCASGRADMVQTAFSYEVTGGPKGLVFAAQSGDMQYIASLALQRTCGDAASDLGCGTEGQAPSGGSPSRWLELEDVPDGTYTLLVETWSGSTEPISITARESPPTHGECIPGGSWCLGGNTCHALTPGATPTCERPSCEDGSDNDGDGRTDFPADPGCLYPDDNGEEDPAIAPTCADGADNDADGQHDWPDDPGCAAASDTLEIDDCAPDVPVNHYPEDVSISSGAQHVVYSTQSHLTAPVSCDPAQLSSLGGEGAFGFTIDRPVTKIRIDATGKRQSNDVQSVLYVRTPSCAVETASDPCAASTSAVWFHLDIPSPAVGDYVVIEDKLGALMSSNGQSIYSDFYVHAYLPTGAACDPLNGFYVCSAPDTCGSTSHVCE